MSVFNLDDVQHFDPTNGPAGGMMHFQKLFSESYRLVANRKDGVSGQTPAQEIAEAAMAGAPSRR